MDDLKFSSSTTESQMPNFEVCEDFFSTEQNHPEFSLQMKDQSGGTKGPNKSGLFSSRKTGRLLDLRVFSLVTEPMILSKITPTNLLWFFEMMMFRNQ